MERRTLRLGTISVATVSLAAALLGVAAPTGGATAADEAATGSLTWSACPTTVPAPPGEVGPTVPVECATLAVPLDYDDPAAGAVDLALYRLATADPAQRMGNLVMSPGGPGLPARQFLAEVSGGMQPPVQARYDLVTFDSRGVGASDGLHCGTGQDLTASLDDPIGDQLRFAEELATACRAEAADLLPTMTTAVGARDLESVRRALGDEKLTFVGFSYATLLGAVYAELHPDRVGRLVLDGPFDPATGYLELMQRQAVGADAALERFFAWCDTDAACRFPGTSAEGVWEYLAWQSGETPLPTADGRQVTASQFQTVSLVAAFAPEPAYPQIAEAFRAAYEGDASILADVYQGFVDSGPAGPYFAQMCGDDPARYDASDIQGVAWRLIDEATHLYWIVREALTCAAFEPSPTPLPQVAVAEGEIPPALLVGNRLDPTSPYPAAVALNAALGGSRLLTFEGGGHVISFRGVPCVDEAVAAYLLDGVLPPTGAVCTPPAPA